MRKLKLSVDQLQVESFHAVEREAQRGTVAGNDSWVLVCSEGGNSCKGWCSADTACQTCDASCNGTCYNSCGASCAGTCGSCACSANMTECGCQTWETCVGEINCA
ncbi:MAG TPA: hypothetical protein VLK84_18700 [Longimicrobium sp.]|nr:hypothetical protein [Longimicrobium sp.]